MSNVRLKGKPRGVPLARTLLWCVCGGGVALHTAPSRHPVSASQNESRELMGVSVPGRHGSHSKPTPGGGSTAPRCSAPHRVQSRKETPAAQRSLRLARGGEAGRGHGWLEAGPAQELSSRRLMGTVVLGTSQAPSKGSGNYTSR